MAKVAYFLEDRAQEDFIKALVEKVAEVRNYPNPIEHEVVSSRGGSKSIEECREFLEDCEKARQIDADFLVVAIDGNCVGYSEKKREIEVHINQENPFQDRIVYAIPNPHIERWYLYDQGAFRLATNATPPEIPEYKCKRDYYKGILRKALRDGEVLSLAGGSELASDIVQNIRNINTVARQHDDLQHFIDGLNGQLARLA